MKVMITGAGGLLGAALVPALQARRDDVFAFRHAECDVTDAAAYAARARECRPEWILHLAAHTKVDACEQEPERASLVNAFGARNAAAAASECGAALLYVSTDYVFDGRATRPYEPGDPVAPLGVYGRTKWAGEEAVRELCARHAIVRTSWLFGPGGANFVDTMLDKARAGHALTVVDDQTGSPTYTPDLAAQLLRLADGRHFGTFHCTNSGSATWRELAQHAIAAAGLDVKVAPITTAELGRPAPRPAYSVLGNDWTERLTGRRMPEWRDAVERHVRSKVAA